MVSSPSWLGSERDDVSLCEDKLSADDRRNSYVHTTARYIEMTQDFFTLSLNSLVARYIH